MDVQLPLRLVDQKIAERISWMHGNLYVASFKTSVSELDTHWLTQFDE